MHPAISSDLDGSDLSEPSDGDLQLGPVRFGYPDRSEIELDFSASDALCAIRHMSLPYWVDGWEENILTPIPNLDNSIESCHNYGVIKRL